MSWHVAVAAGGALQAGQEIAIIYWDDGTEEIIVSPIDGTVERTNPQIVHQRLHMTPPQWALVVK